MDEMAKQAFETGVARARAGDPAAAAAAFTEAVNREPNWVLARLNRESPAPVDYLFVDMNANFIDVDSRWANLIASPPRYTSPWEAVVLRDYEYVLPPKGTRPIGYVLLRRKGVPRSDLERRENP